jgi:hypothetical protein
MIEFRPMGDNRKQATLLWLQNPKQQTADDFNNIWPDICGTFKKKKCDHMIAKVNNFDSNENTRKMCKGINEFKRAINLAHM